MKGSDSEQANPAEKNTEKDPLLTEQMRQQLALQRRSEGKSNKSINNGDEMNTEETGKEEKPIINDSTLKQDGSVKYSSDLLDRLFRLIEINDAPSLARKLEDEGVLALEVRSERKFTLASLACYKNAQECFFVAVEHALKRDLKGVYPEER